jgi:hypothetical protein
MLRTANKFDCGYFEQFASFGRIKAAQLQTEGDKSRFGGQAYISAQYQWSTFDPAQVRPSASSSAEADRGSNR